MACSEINKRTKTLKSNEDFRFNVKTTLFTMQVSVHSSCFPKSLYDSVLEWSLILYKNTSTISWTVAFDQQKRTIYVSICPSTLFYKRMMSGTTGLLLKSLWSKAKDIW